MICLDCIEAGRLLAAAEATARHSNPWHWNRTYAAERHQACLERHMARVGPNYENIVNTYCDCHHKIVSALNRQLVPVKEVVE